MHLLLPRVASFYRRGTACRARAANFRGAADIGRAAFENFGVRPAPSTARGSLPVPSAAEGLPLCFQSGRILRHKILDVAQDLFQSGASPLLRIYLRLEIRAFVARMLGSGTVLARESAGAVA